MTAQELCRQRLDKIYLEILRLELKLPKLEEYYPNAEYTVRCQYMRESDILQAQTLYQAIDSTAGSYE